MTLWRNYLTVLLTTGLFACGSSSSSDPNATNSNTGNSGAGGAAASSVCNGVKGADGTCYQRCSMNSDCDTDAGEVCASATVNGQADKLCAPMGNNPTVNDTNTTNMMGTDTNNNTNNTNGTDTMNMGNGSNGTDAMNNGNTMGSGGANGGDMPFGVCPETIEFKGQLMGDGADVPNGGVFSNMPMAATDMSGLKAIVAQVPEMNDMEVEGSWQVTNALVISTSYLTEQDVPRSQTSFWIADGEAAMEVRLYYPEIMAGEYPDFQVRAGQRISFTATKLSRYFSSLQIAGGTNWSLVSTNEPVYVFEPTNELGACGDDNACKDMEESKYVHRVVRITGLLGDYGDEGAGYTCGGDAKCWGVKYGDGTNTVILRTTSKFVETGQCITFVGPVSYFQGNPQLNVDNFDWLRSY